MTGLLGFPMDDDAGVPERRVDGMGPACDSACQAEVRSHFGPCSPLGLRCSVPPVNPLLRALPLRSLAPVVLRIMMTRSGPRALTERAAWWRRSAGLVNRWLASEVA